MRKQAATLLGDSALSIEGKKIVRMLNFFGVSWSASTVTELLDLNTAGNDRFVSGRLICSSSTFLRLIEDLERNQASVQFWKRQIHSVFVYAGNDSEALQKLVQRLSGNDRAGLQKINNGNVGDVAVSNHLDEFCGVMAGVRTTASKCVGDAEFTLNAPEGNAISIMSVNDGAIFSRFCIGK